MLAILVLSVLTPLLPARAQPQTVPTSRQEISLSFAPLVRQAAPAVVNIYTQKVVRERRVSPLLDDPLFRRFFGEDSGFGMPRERVQRSLGSGVIVRPDGLIVTNDHVIKDSDQITVVLADRREFEATVVTTDGRTDLAVLRIDPRGERLPSLELRDSDTLEVGDLVLAVGNPFGVGQTVTQGIISALARTAGGIADYNFFIQTDAAINPGNSGGALISVDGRLAGINTAIYSRSGGSLGIGFAIPANMVRTVIDAEAHGGKPVRPWLGVSGQAVTSEIAGSLGLPRPAGVLVEMVDARGPAAQAGVRTGDVVVAINGIAVDDPEGLRYRIATLPVGSRAVLGVMRQGQMREVAFTLIAPPEVPPRQATPLAGRQPLAGATIANLSPALAEEMSLAGPQQGVIVVAVARGSPAGRLGIQAGDILLKINDKPVTSVRDVTAITGNTARAWKLSIRRGDNVLNTIVEG